MKIGAPDKPKLHPIHGYTLSASDDPVGARVAVLAYAAIIGYPSFATGGLRIKAGEAQWRKAIAEAQPLWIGAAWYHIEQLEHEWQLDREDEQTTKDN